MSNLVPFTYGETNVRTLAADGEPWFVARDVCRVLSIRNVADAMGTLDEDEKGVASTDTRGGDQRVSIVNEPGLYSLILRSRKPEAKAFKRWIVHEVIPSIRKTGGYGQPDPASISRSDLARMVIDAETARETAEATVREMEPKADGYDRFLSANGSVLVAEAAKMLGLPAKSLRRFLIDQSLVFTRTAPCGITIYDRYTGHERHFETRCTVVQHKNTPGDCAHYTLRVTPAGLDLIRQRLVRQQSALRVIEGGTA